MKEIRLHETKTIEKKVTENMLANRVGSGDVSVYATPMMIALMEECASSLLASFLEEGETSVGIRMDATHDAATPLSMNVKATAKITAVDGKKVTFQITAIDEADTIGIAKHERFIVNKERFEQKAMRKQNCTK